MQLVYVQCSAVPRAFIPCVMKAKVACFISAPSASSCPGLDAKLVECLKGGRSSEAGAPELVCWVRPGAQGGAALPRKGVTISLVPDLDQT